MRVEELMTKKVFTVDPHDMIDRVFFLIHYEKVRHLPVVEKGKVVGMVSDRDMYKVLGPKSNSNAIENSPNSIELHVIPKKVQNIMRRGVISVSPSTLASNAASLRAEKKIATFTLVTGSLIGSRAVSDGTKHRMFMDVIRTDSN